MERPSPDETEPAPSGFRHGLRALRHQNFRRFWTGAVISNSGTWLQNLVVPYVLLEITGRAVWVGIATFGGLLPTMLLGPVSGNVADRFPRRNILFVSTALSAVIALGLWFAWEGGLREPVGIVAFAAAGGFVHGFSIAAWQSFIPLLVPAEDLPSAISLNSLQFNIARMIGPVAGGTIIATLGPSSAFLINGLSFLAVFVALLVIDPGDVRQKIDPQPIVAGFTAALRYIRSQPGIVMGILIAVCVAGLGYPVVSFIVIFADKVYDVGPAAVGRLSGLLGFGSILAAPLVTGVIGDIPRATLIKWGLPFYGASVMVFGASTEPVQGSIAIVMVGFFFLTLVTSSNIAVQTIVSDRIRGRVMAVRIMAFTGAFPLGSLIQTAVADRVGPRPVVMTSGALLLLIGLGLRTQPRMLARLDDPPDTS